MPTQLEKLALTDPSNNDTQVFSVVQEGGAEASRQVLSIEPSDATAQIENDRELITSKDYDITVTGLYSDDAAKTQLESWAESTDLRWGGYGLDGRILQGEGTMNYQEDYEDNLTFRFNSPRRGTGDYSTTTGKHTADLSYSLNGLALYKWGDADGNEEADGWTFSGGSTTFDEANGEQDFSTTAAGGQTAYRQIYFPFVKQVTFFVDVTAVTVNTGVSIYIEEYNASDTLINTSTATNISSTGVKSNSVTLDADTVYLRTVVDIGQDDDISFKDAGLNLGSTTNFKQFYT